METTTNLQGINEINMGVLHIERIHNIIVAIERLNVQQYYNGQPTQDTELRLLVNWYAELSGVLKKEQREHALSYFLEQFKRRPIVNTGTSLIIPKDTEEKMFEFRLWLFDMMYQHKLLTKVGVEYGHLQY